MQPMTGTSVCRKACFKPTSRLTLVEESSDHEIRSVVHLRYLLIDSRYEEQIPNKWKTSEENDL